MKTYKLDPEKLPKQLRSIILLYGATFLVMLVVLYFINRNNPNPSQMTWMIPLLAVLYGFMGWRAYKTRADLWNGYSLQVGDQGIIQNQPKYPELRIARQDVTGLDEKPNGLIISTTQAQRVLGIPREFLSAQDFDSIRDTLTAWVAENNARLGRETGVIEADLEPVEDAAALAAGTAASVGSAVDQAAESAAESVDQAAEKVDVFVDEAADKVDGFVDEAADKVDDALDNAAEKVDDFADDAAVKVEEVKDDAANAWENVKDGAENLADDAGDALEDAAAAVEDKAEDVKEGVENAWEDVKDGAADLADEVKDAVDDAANAVEDKADEIKRDLDNA